MMPITSASNISCVLASWYIAGKSSLCLSPFYAILKLYTMSTHGLMAVKSVITVIASSTQPLGEPFPAARQSRRATYALVRLELTSLASEPMLLPSAR